MGTVHKELRFDGPLMVEKITMFKTSALQSGHRQATFEGLLYADSAEASLYSDFEGKTATFWFQDVVEFAGLLDKVDVKATAGVYTVYGEVVSATVMLDQLPKSRSFQNIALQYGAIAREIMGAYPGGDIMFVPTDKAVGAPIYQYNETDWEFLKRLASHFNTSIAAEATSAVPNVWFGLRNGSATHNFSTNKFSTGIDNRVLVHRAGANTVPRKSIVVESYERCKVGDKAIKNGQQYVITDTSAELVGDELLYRYTLDLPHAALYTEKYYNEKLVGCSIEGRVISRQADTVRLHLSIDAGQDEATAFDYLWVPATNNLLYAMPLVGETVSLYFAGRDDSSGVAVDCVRSNDARYGGQMENTNKRGMYTEHKKNMFIEPAGMGIESPGAGFSAILDDTQGLSISSSKQLQIKAQGAVKALANKCYYYTPINFGLYQLGSGQQGDESSSPMASVVFDGSQTILQAQYGMATMKFDGSYNARKFDASVYKPRYDVSSCIENVLAAQAVCISPD